MKQRMFVGGAAMVLAVAVLFGVGLSASAASDTYKFTIRGNVTAVDRTNKTVTIYTKLATTDKAKADLAGETVEFNVTGAKFYKYDAKGKKVRTTIGSVLVQSEVVAKGAKRGDDRYNVSEITVNPNMFTFVGNVKDRDELHKTLTIAVTSSSYKEKSVKGNDIIVYYGGNTVFRNQDLVEINADELANNEERVKITGEVINGWKYEARTVIDGYTKSK